MNSLDFDLLDLTQESVLSAFECADADLNDFLLNEAKDYQAELLAKTYLLRNPQNNEIVAYYSLLNDVARLDETEKSVRNRINRKIPFAKQRTHYPAVKIGRLAVSKAYAGLGVGGLILRNLKFIFTHGNRTGCRFLTVDAYAAATGFYERNGFRFFTDADKDDDTRLMYFDFITVR